MVSFFQNMIETRLIIIWFQLLMKSWRFQFIDLSLGGHHFGTSHTLARYESAFYSPMMSNRQNFESWEEAGSIDSAARANAIWKQLLQEYTQPELDPAVDDALVDYVERRKLEIASNEKDNG